MDKNKTYLIKTGIFGNGIVGFFALVFIIILGIILAYFTAPRVDNRFISVTGVIIDSSHGRLLSNDFQPVVFWGIGSRAYHIIEFFDNDGKRQIGNLFYREIGRSSYNRPATKKLRIGDSVSVLVTDVSNIYKRRIKFALQENEVNIAVLDTDKIVWDGFPIRIVIYFLLIAGVCLASEFIIPKIARIFATQSGR